MRHVSTFLHSLACTRLAFTWYTSHVPLCHWCGAVHWQELIFPMAPFVFKTMIWYQGEANVNCNAETNPAWLTNYYGA